MSANVGMFLWVLACFLMVAYSLNKLKRELEDLDGSSSDMCQDLHELRARVIRIDRELGETKGRVDTLVEIEEQVKETDV